MKDLLTKIMYVFILNIQMTDLKQKRESNFFVGQDKICKVTEFKNKLSCNDRICRCISHFRDTGIFNRQYRHKRKVILSDKLTLLLSKYLQHRWSKLSFGIRPFYEDNRRRVKLVICKPIF